MLLQPIYEKFEIWKWAARPLQNKVEEGPGPCGSTTPLWYRASTAKSFDDKAGRRLFVIRGWRGGAFIKPRYPRISGKSRKWRPCFRRRCQGDGGGWNKAKFSEKSNFTPSSVWLQIPPCQTEMKKHLGFVLRKFGEGLCKRAAFGDEGETVHRWDRKKKGGQQRTCLKANLYVGAFFMQEIEKND